MSCFISFSIPIVPLCSQRQVGRVQILGLCVPPNFGLTLHVQNTLRAECVLKWEETEVLGNWTRYTKHICPDVQLRRMRPGEADRWWQVKKSTFLAAALPMCRLLCQVLRRKQWLRLPLRADRQADLTLQCDVINATVGVSERIPFIAFSTGFVCVCNVGSYTESHT